jgi:hypothetical protein
MDKYLTAFLIGFSWMMTAHYLLEPTWGVQEVKPDPRRLIINYTIGTLGICCAFLYLHAEMWMDLTVCVAGAGSATVLAHSNDWLLHLIKRDRANGLIEKPKDEA